MTAEEYIKKHTKNCTNYTGVVETKNCNQIYYEWLTPEEALHAIKLAKEEVRREMLNKC